LKWLAEYCGTSVDMIEKHYGRFVQTHAPAQLALLMGSDADTEKAAVGAVRGAKPATVAAHIAAAARKPLQIEMVPRGFEPLLPT
jgi:hypothetical protein